MAAMSAAGRGFVPMPFGSAIVLSAKAVAIVKLGKQGIAKSDVLTVVCPEHGETHHREGCGVCSGVHFEPMAPNGAELLRLWAAMDEAARRDLLAVARGLVRTTG